MTEQPQGTVSLLFTDIEGSTRLLQELGRERYADALTVHRELLRKAFSEHGGYEVDYEGDAFFVAFARAEDAVSAAAAAQRALAAADWPDGHEFRVRMGVHTGEPLAVPPKYVGLDVHRAARIMAAGHGGQVLLSRATRQGLDDRFPVRDLGEHRLKDLLQPEPLAQLVIPGLPDDFPALKTLGNRPTNLPVQPNPLLGREREVAAVAELLRDEQVHVVTLTGPGGTGKTRLALQTAAELLDEFRSGVFFVSLAPISDANLVISTVMETLALREVPGEDLADTLIGYLAEKQMLLVLDNFEQVVTAAPSLSKLVAAAPETKLLVTSRERLRISAERLFAVPPLELPDPDRLVAEVLIENAAVALFLARAQTVKPGFALTHENAQPIAKICQRLDGLPLALELAAARIAILTPHALLERLDRRLALLTTGARDADERQQTLRRTIEWSYDLLSEPERTLFIRLSVFVDGCSFDAAEAVCDPASRLGLDLVDGLQSLVEKSLLRHKEDVDAEPRFWMLETIKEYAAERLAESSEVEDLRRRHAEHFLSLAEEVEPKLTTGQQAATSALLSAEQGNFRAALDWARETGEHLLQLRLAAALGRFWYQRSLARDGLAQLEAALAVPVEQPDSLRAKALSRAAQLRVVVGDLARAQELAESALALWQSLGDLRGVTEATNDLGMVCSMRGDLRRARVLLERTCSLARETGDTWALGLASNNLACDAWEEGEVVRARALAAESVRLLRQVGERATLANALNTLGSAAFDDGDESTGTAAFAESLRISHAIGYTETVAAGLEGLAAVAARAGDAERAAMLLGAGDAVSRGAGVVPQPGAVAWVERITPSARQALGDRFDAVFAAGTAMAVDEAVTYALEHLE